MFQYHELLNQILKNGNPREDRTGTGTVSVFGARMEYDLALGFPLVTTKKIHVRSVIHELLWMLAGDTNIKYLKDNNVRIWDEWADQNGDLGPIYGKQWRSWSAANCQIDQIKNAIDLLTNDYNSRRVIVSAWNPADVPDMKLPPCHMMFQFYSREMRVEERAKLPCVRENGFELEFKPGANQARAHKMLDMVGAPRRALDCQMYQRSADAFLGVPFNIASYALLTQMVGHVTGHAPGRFIHVIGDAHIYLNHIDACEDQMTRSFKALSTLRLNPAITDIDRFTFDDITVENYSYWPAITGEVSV